MSVRLVTATVAVGLVGLVMGGPAGAGLLDSPTEPDHLWGLGMSSPPSAELTAGRPTPGLDAAAQGRATTARQGGQAVSEEADRLPARARRDVWLAIRLTFPRSAWAAARCIVKMEVGAGSASRWYRRFSDVKGAEGEVGPWQFHPGWHTDGWDGRPPKWPYPERFQHDALYATRKARVLWRESGRSFRKHWPNTARECGVK